MPFHDYDIVEIPEPRSFSFQGGEGGLVLHRDGLCQVNLKNGQTESTRVSLSKESLDALVCVGYAEGTHFLVGKGLFILNPQTSVLRKICDLPYDPRGLCVGKDLVIVYGTRDYTAYFPKKLLSAHPKLKDLIIRDATMREDMCFLIAENIPSEENEKENHIFITVREEGGIRREGTKFFSDTTFTRIWVSRSGIVYLLGLDQEGQRVICTFDATEKKITVIARLPPGALQVEYVPNLDTFYVLTKTTFARLYAPNGIIIENTRLVGGYNSFAVDSSGAIVCLLSQTGLLRKDVPLVEELPPIYLPETEEIPPLEKAILDDYLSVLVSHESPHVRNDDSFSRFDRLQRVALAPQGRFAMFRKDSERMEKLRNLVSSKRHPGQHIMAVFLGPYVVGVAKITDIICQQGCGTSLNVHSVHCDLVLCETIVMGWVLTQLVNWRLGVNTVEFPRCSGFSLRGLSNSNVYEKLVPQGIELKEDRTLIFKNAIKLGPCGYEHHYPPLSALTTGPYFVTKKRTREQCEDDLFLIQEHLRNFGIRLQPHDDGAYVGNKLALVILMICKALGLGAGGVDVEFLEKFIPSICSTTSLISRKEVRHFRADGLRMPDAVIDPLVLFRNLKGALAKCRKKSHEEALLEDHREMEANMVPNSLLGLEDHIKPWSRVSELLLALVASWLSIRLVIFKVDEEKGDVTRQTICPSVKGSACSDVWVSVRVEDLHSHMCGEPSPCPSKRNEQCPNQPPTIYLSYVRGDEPTYRLLVHIPESTNGKPVRVFEHCILEEEKVGVDPCYTPAKRVPSYYGR